MITILRNKKGGAQGIIMPNVPSLEDYRKAAAVLGSIKSKKKTLAAKRNGKLGGRPKKDAK